MMGINPGTIQMLHVSRQVDFGYYLIDQEENEVLLPNGEVIGEIEIEDEIEVFVYHDHEGRPIATMKTPKIVIDTYEWVEVVGVNRGLGVFIDIGLTKDMLLSKDDLPLFEELWPEVGDKLYCSLMQDRNGRLLARLATEPVMWEIGVVGTREVFNKNIKGTIYKTVKVGSYIYTDDKLVGFIHESQRKVEPRLGQVVEGRVVDVKEDGSVNVSLLPRGHEGMDTDSQAIYDYMEGRSGAMPYSDKSTPEDIQQIFNMSKGAFKRALGKLMKEGKVYQEEGWTYNSARK
ncbi:S1 RNA-binding domain-containing protein [Bacillus sp. DJP31]|uniref:CvfB family protein n=1 Tax=Bacillus sp. DJP31 TaxID=3409789 RepID=UPI003BB4DBD7